MTIISNRRFLILALLCWALHLVMAGPVAANAPQAPSNVSASDGLYANKVSIIWDAVPGAEEYIILRSEKPVSQGGVMTRLATLSRTSYDDTPPQCGIIYYYWVRAVNPDGASKFNHAKGSCGTPGTEPMTGTLQAPENVSATDGDFTDKIHIAWNRSAGAASYEIYRAEDFSDAKTRVGTTTGTNFDDTTADCCIDYYYWVKAKKGSEESDFFYSDIGYRNCPVPAPANVNASDGDHENAVLVTWQASVGATSYDVYRSTSPAGAKTKIATITGTTHTDPGVNCDAVYFYWIQARNLCSTSPYSNSDSGYPKCLTPSNGDGNDTPGPAPGAPFTPTGVSASDGQYTDRILITWGTAANASWYDIYRSSRVGGSDRIRIASTTGTSYSDNSIPVSTVFSYWIMAKNSAGESEFSNFDTGYRLCPPAPGSVSASKGTHLDRIRITWGSSKGALMYDVYRSIFPTAPEGMRIKIATVKATSYDDMFEPCVVNCSSCSTSSDNPFYYWVTARSLDCISPFSNTAEGYIHCKPNVPTGVTASDGGFAYHIQVKWNTTSDEPDFELWRSTAPDGPKTKIITTQYAVFNDSDIACNTTYYYWVRRIDTDGVAGDFSNYDSGYSACN